jgi:hypothetical protein
VRALRSLAASSSAAADERSTSEQLRSPPRGRIKGDELALTIEYPHDHPLDIDATDPCGLSRTARHRRRSG